MTNAQAQDIAAAVVSSCEATSALAMSRALERARALALPHARPNHQQPVARPNHQQPVTAITP